MKGFLVAVFLLFGLIPQQHNISHNPRVAVGGVAECGDYSGLKVWLQGDAGVTTDVGIETWADQSGSGNDATQTVDGNQPAVGATLNGRDTVQFNDNNWFTMGDLSGEFDTNAEYWYVSIRAEDPPSSSAYTGLPVETDSSTVATVFWVTGVIEDGFMTTVRKNVGDPGQDLSTAWYIYNAWSDASDWTAELDGSQIYSTGTNTYADPDTDEFFIGRGANSTYWGHGMKVAEVCIFNDLLSASERDDLLAGLQSAWDV